MKLTTIFFVIKFHLNEFLLRLFSDNTRLHPYKMLLQITNDCDSKCKSCSIWNINTKNPALKKNELSLLDFEALFVQSRAHLIWLALSGGEVSLHEDFTQIIDLAILNCPKLKIITFTTNGLNPEKILEYSLHIKKYNLDLFVVISLDGDETLHDEIRGIPGNYKKAQKCYKLLKDNKINVYFGITVSQLNQKYINNQFQNISEKFKAISIVHSHGIYNRSNKSDNKELGQSLLHIFKLYKIKSLSEIIEYFYIGMAYRFLTQDRLVNPIPCEVLSSSLHVYPNGDIHGCMFMPKLGNIKNDQLSEVLNSDNTLNQRELIKSNQCPKCWMNCYAPHSIMQHPIKSALSLMAIKS
jgi:MoaA/NifB/PqqE/SkfB family radical SAM enzyme